MRIKGRWLILILVILIGGGASWWAYQQATAAGQTTVSSSDLSERSQEFIKNDSSQGTGIWSTVDFTANTDENTIPADTQIRSQCLTFSVPTKVMWQSEELQAGRCTVRLKSLAPFGYLVIARYAQPIFSEDSGIQLRRRLTDQYHEKKLSQNSFSHSALFSDSESVTGFGWQDQTMVSVALTGAQPITPELEVLVGSILQTTQLSPVTLTATASASVEAD